MSKNVVDKEGLGLLRPSRVPSDLQARLERIRHQMMKATDSTIACITAPPGSVEMVAATVEPVVFQPILGVVIPEPVEMAPPAAVPDKLFPNIDTSSLSAETRRKFENYGRSISAALSGFQTRIAGRDRNLAS